MSWQVGRSWQRAGTPTGRLSHREDLTPRCSEAEEPRYLALPGRQRLLS